MGGPRALRDYQQAAVKEAHRRNLLVVLPTNAGKTIISAMLIEDILYSENSRESSATSPARKIIFLAPGRALATQQAQVLMQQISPLSEEELPNATLGADSTLWRLGLVIGMGELSVGEAMRTRQVVVMTPTLFLNALIHAHVRMEDVALLVLDEAHHLRGNSMYATIMEYFYLPCKRRPRVLALTASPVEKARTEEPSAAKFLEDLAELEKRLDCAAWSHPVPEEVRPHHVPFLLGRLPAD